MIVVQAQERSSGQQYMEEMMRAKGEEVAQLQEQVYATSRWMSRLVKNIWSR